MSQSEYCQCSISGGTKAAWMDLLQGGGTYLGTQNQRVPLLTFHHVACTLPVGYWDPKPSYCQTSFLGFAE
jgi:hypothetical protein